MKRKGLCQAIVFVELLLVYCATQSQQVTQADCNENASLQCPGINGMDFISVTWYKLVNGKKFGIIKKRKRDQAPQMYNFTRIVSIGEDYSLFLPRVEPADSGTYMCGIGANIGGQSQYPTVDLAVNECVTQADPTSPVVDLSPTNSMNTTQSIQVQDLTILWAAVGYVAVALVKIVLSLISVWILRITFKRKQQRRRSR